MHPFQYKEVTYREEAPGWMDGASPPAGTDLPERHELMFLTQERYGT